MNTPKPVTTTRVLFLTAWIALASTASAQTCSGGADGGMDATGNQCSALAMGGSTPGSGASGADYGERQGDVDSWGESAGFPRETVSTIDSDSIAHATVQTASARRVLRPVDAVIEP